MYTSALEDQLATAQSLKERVYSLEAQNTKLAECLTLLESTDPGPACLQTTVDEPEANQHREEGTSNSEAPRRGKLEFNLLNKINGGGTSGYSKAVGWNSHVTHTRTNDRCSSLTIASRAKGRQLGTERAQGTGGSSH